MAKDQISLTKNRQLKRNLVGAFATRLVTLVMVAGFSAVAESQIVAQENLTAPPDQPSYSALTQSRKHSNTRVVFIDDSRIYRSLLQQGQALVADGTALDHDRWLDLMADLPSTIDLSEIPCNGLLREYDEQAESHDAIASASNLEDTDASSGRVRVMRPPLDFPASQLNEQNRQRIFDATMVIGSLYKCDKCDRDHLSTAGGVLISDDGLVLTNYHVLDVEDPVTMVVGNRHGVIYPVVEFIAGNPVDDIALIRIAGTRHPYVDLASTAPGPATRVLTVSHPKGRFFHASWGNVARYSIEFRRGKSKPSRWLEITNPFTRGSSGCGVFNVDGYLVGLISKKVHATDRSGKNVVTDLTCFKCVPLPAIEDLFADNIQHGSQPVHIESVGDGTESRKSSLEQIEREELNESVEQTDGR